tara:strand:- start:509 stop:751 length:243 start_codon:yes stop_codon:yes gene_type:complete
VKVKYSFQLECSCPVDSLSDLYEVEITSTKTIRVEDILMTVETINKNDFQENITLAISREIPATVKTIGYHSGIKTVCEI